MKKPSTQSLQQQINEISRKAMLQAVPFDALVKIWERIAENAAIGEKSYIELVLRYYDKLGESGASEQETGNTGPVLTREELHQRLREKGWQHRDDKVIQ